MKSWKTTTLGIMAILTAVFGAVKAMIDNDPTTTFDAAVTASAIMSGVALIFAKDESSGIKAP